MPCYLIGYDLISPGKDYGDLIKAIKALGSGWCHCLDSTWIITNSGSATDIRDALTPHLDSNDKLLVIKTSVPAAWLGLDDERSKWLRETLN
jgi:hypothetical protein